MKPERGLPWQDGWLRYQPLPKKKEERMALVLVLILTAVVFTAIHGYVAMKRYRIAFESNSPELENMLRVQNNLAALLLLLLIGGWVILFF